MRSSVEKDMRKVSLRGQPALKQGKGRFRAERGHRLSRRLFAARFSSAQAVSTKLVSRWETDARRQPYPRHRSCRQGEIVFSK
jgi:hypothetical protein